MQHTEPVRIAVIDDDEDDYFIIAEYIREIEGKKFIIDWYKDYPLAIEKIKDRAYHLYFVDYSLGKETGLELLQEAASLGCEDPFILLTGKGNRSIDIKAMQNGATDYLVKSELNAEKLERCIRYSLDRAAFLKEIRSRETRYRNLFENSKDTVFIADPDLLFMEMNQAGSLLFECGSRQLIGSRLYDFIPDDEEKKKICQAMKAGRNIRDFEIKILALNKEVKQCLLSLSTQGKTIEKPLMHGIIHDISNIKKAELAKLQAEKLASNERLLRMLAHEIRNPLNNITLSIDALKESFKTREKQENLVSILQRNAGRINQIITELLKTNRTQEQLVFEKHPLQDIIDESLAIASDRINLHAITVKKSYPDKPLEIAADKPRLVIAFLNIMINGIEAMEKKKGELAISLSASTDSYTISIRDNGTGIPEEYLSRLFEPFFTMKKNGMGLGLVASYSIIHSHKGVMHVESAKGQGTNFVIRFNKNLPENGEDGEERFRDYS